MMENKNIAKAIQSDEIVMSIKGLCKSFGSNHVLRDFSLNLFRGENIAVIGKSGSGKSVLIKCVIGLLKADKGSITVLGEDVGNLNRRQLDEMRVKVGFLFQSNALYDSMTIRENLEFPLRRHRRKDKPENVDDLVMEALSNVGLEETVDMMPSELSGGMRKRIALARTLILKPEIILYDEPTTGLDPITGREISQLMVEIQKKYNTSSIIISHDMNCVKIASNRIAMLIDGTNYATGPFDELKEFNDPKVRSFF
ncbi:MAG TPA: ATP-binding cassette domain-containing protein [Flavobacteriales bacterium]|nr:ABC transporter ATP-binding protein [Flavobacteriales bacterium]HRE75852.1 ATP-binding cassette domain-containing protein [Flavobacteriales bacterium]HRE98574.1 ATP-binding cassette domain-containing protein [Flavobacteriales bacterium]HRJ34769.1 ATP-binding cassette domain-containing protein [Flavobacteriales bacterium]HRJ38751.1 ATP-binding cassette domain-containing protein [Flavobacteriales bacterium]